MSILCDQSEGSNLMFLLNSIWRDCTSLPSQYLSPSNQMYPQQVPNTLLTAFSPLNTTLSKQSLGCFFTFPNSTLQESSFFTSRNEHSPNSSILTVPMKVELNSFFGQVPSITHPSLNSTLRMPLFFMVKELSPGEIQKSYMPENLQLSSGPMMRKQLMGGWCETCYAYILVPSIRVACNVSPMMGLRGFKNMLRQYELARRQDTVILNLSTGSFSTAAWLMKQGKMVQLATELYSADLGWHALMGKDILVRLKSPEKIFLPIILTISFPTERSLSICFSSSHLIPPSEYAKWTLQSSFLADFLSSNKITQTQVTTVTCLIVPKTTRKTAWDLAYPRVRLCYWLRSWPHLAFPYQRMRTFKIILSRIVVIHINSAQQHY